MKNKRIVFCSLLILLAGVIQLPVKAQQKQDTKAVIYQLDVKKSKLFWKAPKNRHNGFILFNSGTLNGFATGLPGQGTFSINMNSMSSTGEPTAVGRKLVDDKLRSEDFFAVSEYPVATMVVKQLLAEQGSSTYRVSGELTIKGLTKPIEFITIMKQKGSTVTATAEMIISREKWHINHRPQQSVWDFASRLKDNLAGDEIPIRLELVFTSKANTQSENEEVMTSYGPKGITRNIIQDRKGNIWIASWEGIFKYNGKSFTNMTSKVSSARFFSVLQDGKGNFWFGSIGSGVYYYDGKSFQNYTTKQGLAGNDITCIYEDETGKIWFGTSGGASCYDGKSFRNYTTKEGLPGDGVNAILQDKKGKFWFGTNSYACVYDGKKFTVLTNHNARTSSVLTNKGSNPFMNVRSITQDSKGNIWLGGADGLWRYDGITFTNLTQNFTGYVYKDKKGNIWTSSQSAYNQDWTLSRYDGKILSNKNPTVTEITINKGMICGILEADDGSIWFGTGSGLYRYDGNTFNNFKN